MRAEKTKKMTEFKIQAEKEKTDQINKKMYKNNVYRIR